MLSPMRPRDTLVLFLKRLIELLRFKERKYIRNRSRIDCHLGIFYSVLYRGSSPCYSMDIENIILRNSRLRMFPATLTFIANLLGNLTDESTDE